MYSDVFCKAVLTIGAGFDTIGEENSWGPAGMRRGVSAVKRESFQSRLGFILVSAGCAIGIGNVWKFPFVTGQNGGGVFVLFYLCLLYTSPSPRA